MNEEERNVRWQEILDAQADFLDEPVPLHGDERGKRQPQNGADAERARARRRNERKSQQFNEALSSLGSWSSVEPRRRLSA